MYVIIFSSCLQILLRSDKRESQWVSIGTKKNHLLGHGLGASQSNCHQYQNLEWWKVAFNRRTNARILVVKFHYYYFYAAFMVFQAGAIAEIHELGLGSSLQQQTAGRLGCAAIRNLLSVTQHNRGRLTQFFFTLLQVARISVSNSRLLYFIVQRGKSLFVNLSNDTCVDKIFLGVECHPYGQSSFSFLNNRCSLNWKLD